jgi:hypothetical protein
MICFVAFHQPCRPSQTVDSATGGGLMELTFFWSSAVAPPGHRRPRLAASPVDRNSEHPVRLWNSEIGGGRHTRS